MKLQQNQCSVTKIIPYKDTVVNFLKQPYSEDAEKISSTNVTTLGGILSDVNYTWVANGPLLEVLSTRTGCKEAGWTFGSILHDCYTKVTCVDSFSGGNSNGPVLVIGLTSSLTRGMVCVFDVHSSKVVRAIQIDKPVSSIHVIDAGSDNSLPGPLRALDGIIAVGTNEGKILLIDLCRQACDEAISTLNSDYIRNEITFCDVIPVPLQEVPNLEKHKEISLKSGNHLCLQLNDYCTLDNLHVKEPGGDTVLRVNIVEAKISALYYSAQLGTLFVGYNFGVFQLYNLLSVKLEFTSQTHESYIPVSHFAVQEPSDDPRAFCYVWVMYSNTDIGIPGFPVSVLFALHYNTKEFLEGYGNLYQDFHSCSSRFQTDLMSLPGSKINKPVGGNCISLTSYTKSNNKQINCHLQETTEDSLAICAVIWCVWNNAEIESYMCLFDLNQWYKEQMPTNPSEDNSSFMVFLNLRELFDMHTQKSNILLDVKIDPESINQFSCPQRLEEHYYPSSLAYKFICSREDDSIWVYCPGVQKHLLSSIELAGPLCLLRPSDIFLQCITLGLTPLYTEVIYNTQTPVSVQREMVLSVALEHQLISWLCHCAQEWSNGSQSSYGCTLDFLLNWAWQRAQVLKQSASELCEPLFDHSGMRLDQNAHLQLNHCVQQLKHLSSLYEHVVNYCLRFISEEVCEEIKHQFKALQMLSVYLEVLQWLLNVGLLPECPIYMYPRADEAERISAPYPVDSLVRFYNERRATLFDLQDASNVKGNQSCDLLFIDNLIDIECGGEALHAEWRDDGGNGLYPPPSLQALLRTYLIEDVDIEIKHCIFIYVFLDLAMTLDQSRYTPIITHLIKFPAVFEISPSVIKITQAFWQLDHGDFSTAMPHLLNRFVSSEDLKPWHHRVAVKALLAQGQHQHALLYHQVRQPPNTDLQDLCITITLLIVNDLLPEAFHFQRQNRSECNEKELLQHFMEACDKTNQLVHILQLPLGEAEEEALVTYLEKNRRKDNEDYLVKYYMQRSQYAEAYENNDKLNSGRIVKQGLIGQSEDSLKPILVRQPNIGLPKVARDLLTYFSYQKKTKGNTFNWETGLRNKPVPMSVHVHETHDNTVYKSRFMNESLLKARETWSNDAKASNEVPFLSTPKKIEPKKQSSTPVIYPSALSFNLQTFEEKEEEMIPSKRRRVGSRESINTREKSESVNRIRIIRASEILKTPKVKRKNVRPRFRSASTLFDNLKVGSPQSILKVRKLVRKSNSPNERDDSTTPENLDDIENDIQVINKTAVEKIKSSFVDLSNYSVSSPSKITPRKIIQRTPKHMVHFDNSVPLNLSDDEKMEGKTSNVTDDHTIMDVTPVNSSDEKFYSPENSGSETKSAESSNQNVTPVVREIPITIEDKITTPRSGRKRKLNENSVKSRRSYKAVEILDKTTKLITPEVTLEVVKSRTVPKTSTNITLDQLEGSKKVETPKTPEIQKVTFPKISGRKSLTRQVLEQNTIAKALASPRMQTRLSLSKSSTPQKNARGIEVLHSKTITETFHTKATDKITGNIIEDSSSTKKEDVKNTYTTETNPLTSEQIIKHTHNESITKTSTKLTEISYDSDVSSTSVIDPILSGSDVDESFLAKYVQNKTPINNSNIISTDSSSILTESVKKDIQEFEDSQEIEEIVAVEPIKESELQESTSLMTVEAEPEAIQIVADVPTVETQQVFEITDDLTDEDVSFAIHNSMDVQINEASIELKEPENYMEPDFEEEVGNVLTEDSNVGVQLSNIQYGEDSSEDENLSPSVEPLTDPENESISEDNSEEYMSEKEESDLKKSEKIETIEIDDSSNDKQDSETSEEELVTDQEEYEEKNEEIIFEESFEEQEDSDDVQSVAEEEETSEEEKVSGEESEENEQYDNKEESSQEDIARETQNEEGLKRVEISTSTEEDIPELKLDETIDNAETEKPIEIDVRTDETFQSDGSFNILEVNISETDSVFDRSEIKEKEQNVNDECEIKETGSDILISSQESIVTEKAEEPVRQQEEKTEELFKRETRRSRRASSLAPADTPQLRRSKRAGSVDVEMITKNVSIIKPDIDQERLMKIDIDNPQPSTSKGIFKQLQNIEREMETVPLIKNLSVEPEQITEKLSEKQDKDASLTDVSSGKRDEDTLTKTTSVLPKRGRKSNIQEEITESPRRKTRASSLQPEDQIKINTSPFPRRTRKSSLQEDTTDIPRFTRSSSVKLEEQLENKSPSVSKRGRRPSLQEEVLNSPRRSTRASSVQLEEQTTLDSPRQTRASSLEPGLRTPRRVRRKSLQLEETILEDNVQQEEIKTLSRRGRKPSVQKDEQLHTPSRRGRKGSLIDETIQEENELPENKTVEQHKVKPSKRGRKPSYLKETEEKNSEQGSETSTPSRRTRSSSQQEEIKTPSKRGRKPSNASEEETSTTSSGRGRRSSVASEDIEVRTPRRGRRSIDPEPVVSKPSTLEKIEEQIEEYAATHRLTRNQKSIMEKSIHIQQSKKVKENNTANTMETFTGEENYEEYSSSPSTSLRTESSVGTRSSARLASKHSPESDMPETPRRKRRDQGSPGSESASVRSEESEEVGSVGRGKRKSFTAAQQALSTPSKKRRMSQESDNTSKISSIITTDVSVQLEKINVDKEKQKQRSRTSSLSNDDEEAAKSVIRRKTRASILPKRELSEISEESINPEQISDSEIKSTPSRRGRPKKSAHSNFS